jgi:hypothetical protein
MTELLKHPRIVAALPKGERVLADPIPKERRHAEALDFSLHLLSVFGAGAAEAGALLLRRWGKELRADEAIESLSVMRSAQTDLGVRFLHAQRLALNPPAKDLVAMLQSPLVESRILAAAALWKNPHATSVLASVINDPALDDSIVALCAYVAGSFQGGPIEKQIMKVLQDESRPAPYRAYWTGLWDRGPECLLKFYLEHRTLPWQ